MAEKDTPTVDPIEDAGTNAHGVDLNDPTLKGATDQPDVQAANERRMQAVAGTDRPVVEQLRAAQGEPLVIGPDGATAQVDAADSGDAKKK